MSQAATVEQRNAIYRRQLLANYAPLVIEHPAFGWGITTFPAVNGQTVDRQPVFDACRGRGICRAWGVPGDCDGQRGEGSCG